MKVIMLKDVKGVGQRDTLKEVSDGYGLNFLIAQGLAAQATPQKLAELSDRMQKKSLAHTQQSAGWAAVAKRLEGMSVTVHARANPAGSLYEQLSGERIISALRHELTVDIPADALLINAPIKQIGETNVAVRLGSYTAKFTINVVAAIK